MHTQLTMALAQALKTDSDFSISDYEVLAVLSEAPDLTLRARDLRCELQWEKSRLAHHLRRMEQRNLIKRDQCNEDLRAPLVQITNAGLEAIRTAAPAHVARVRELFFAALTPAQIHAVCDASEAVLENLSLHGVEAAADDATSTADPIVDNR